MTAAMARGRTSRSPPLQSEPSVGSALIGQRLTNARRTLAEHAWGRLRSLGLGASVVTSVLPRRSEAEEGILNTGFL